MAEIYVSPTGSDTSGDGSQSNPYQHIHYAIDQANNGDTIICLPGTYDEEEGRNIADKNLTIKSSTDNFEDVIIKVKTLYNTGYAGVYSWLANNGGTVSGSFTVKNITFILDGNLITNWSSASYIIPFFWRNSSSTFEMIGCFIRCDNWSSVDKETRAIQIENNQGKVYKSTFRHFNQSSASETVLWACNSGTLDSKDNIFEDNETVYHSDGTINEDYCCYYNNGSIGITIGSNSITSDPQFTGTDTAKIQDTSPCKDAGTVITGYVENYQGTAPDIGCYEIPAVVYKISGQVTLEGSPVQGAKVRCICQDTNTYVGDTTTDASGNYEFTDLDQNKKYHIVVEYTDPDTGQKYNAESKWDITPVEES